MLTNVRNRRRKKRNRRGRLMVSVLGLVLVVIFSVRCAKLKKKNDIYQKRLVSLQEEYDEQSDRQEQLKEREKYMQTKKFVEEYAKEKLGLIYPNEVVFKAG